MKKVTKKRIPRTYSYWTTDSFLKELKQFCTVNKNALKKHSLTTLLFEKNRSELYHASQKFGGFNKLNEQFNLGLKLRRQNYWTEEKILEDLWVIYNAGNKITDQTLRALRRNDLSGAISSRGSIAYFKKKMGLVKKKENWSKGAIIKTYKELFHKLGTIPTIKQLRENGYQEMEQAIYKKFGRLSALRTATNLVGDRKPPGYWTTEKTITSFKSFCAENKNEIKNSSIGLLLKNKNPKLFSAVNEAGGFRRLNKKLKLGLKLNSSDWTEREVSAEIKKLQSSGIAITEKKLRTLNNSGLKAAIMKKLQSPDYRKKAGIPQRQKEKWTKEKVIEEYRNIHLQKGKFPTTQEVREMGKSGLASAGFKLFGNNNAIKEILNISTDRKSRNYWSLSNTGKELKKFIDTNPISKGDIIDKLRQQNRHDLIGAIYKHNGLRKITKKFGLNIAMKKAGWSKKEILQELKILSNNGVVITQNNLSDLGRNDLLGAITKFGGLNAVKHKLGLAVARRNYWTDQRIIKELKPLIKSFGRIPSNNVLKAMGKNDLACAIKKHGNVRKFSDLLNVPSTGYFRANDNHCLNSGYECLFDNILFKNNIHHSVNERILTSANYRYDFLIGDTYIEICGYDPKEHPDYFKRLDLKRKLYEKWNLTYRIIPKDFFYKDFNTIEKEVLEIALEALPTGPRKKILTDDDIIPYNYWKDLKNVKRELLPLVKKYGRIPFDRELRKERKAPLIHGVYKYHGSFYEVAQKLHLKCMHKPKGFYTRENAIKEYKQLCVKYKRFLTQKELQQMNYFGLLGYIAKIGGLHKFRPLTELNYQEQYLPKGYYTLDKAVKEYKQLCIEKNRFIPSKELVRMQQGPLAAYIQKNGGYYEIRKKTGLNFPALRYPQNYWTATTTKAQYRQFIIELKRKPVCSDFKNRQNLRGAIAKFGGLTHINQTWGKFRS